MTKLYKITDSEDQTYNMCQWGEGVTVKTSGIGRMCGKGFTHWYTDPKLAVLFNPIHGSFDLETAHLWEGEGEIIKEDGLQVGCIEATTLKRIDFPVITLEQKVKFAILCALEVYNEEKFVNWAHNWLDGTDRTVKTAEAATEAAEAAAKIAIRAVIGAAKAAGAAKNINFVRIIDTSLMEEI